MALPGAKRARRFVSNNSTSLFISTLPTSLSLFCMKNLATPAPKFALHKTIVTRFKPAAASAPFSSSMVTTGILGPGLAR